MTITISNTTKIVQLNGLPARIWEGHTDTGIPVHCYITRIAVSNDENHAQFEAELQETSVPSADIQAIPLRMIL